MLIANCINNIYYSDPTTDAMYFHNKCFRLAFLASAVHRAGYDVAGRQGSKTKGWLCFREEEQQQQQQHNVILIQEDFSHLRGNTPFSLYFNLIQLIKTRKVGAE